MAARRSTRHGSLTPERGLPPPPADILSVELATLVDTPPEGADWLHEIKLDGYRIVASVNSGSAELFTRRGNDWTARAPNVVAALSTLSVRNAVLDGELVCLRSDGVTDFQALQNALRDGRSQRLVYFAFDLLYLDGEDQRARPLRARKAALAALLASTPKSAHLRLSEHVEGQGRAVFERACKLGLEGTIAKRADAPYRPGRGKDWLKLKCIARQEFVIGGFTPPGGSRQHLGALLIGVQEEGQLRYAGKVGTGFNARSLRELRARLEPLAEATCPFTPAPRGSPVRGATWVRPELVAEVAFTEFTDDGRLRHPSFQGLREDKPPSAVIRERPAVATETADVRRRPPPRSRKAKRSAP